MKPEAFLALLAGPAQDCMRATGIPASVTLAQAALESGWGEKAPGNNLFGIKADKTWAGPTVTFGTHENLAAGRVAITDKFRAYSSWTAGLIDRAHFLKANPRYAPCFLETTAEGWAHALQKAGYATDPSYATSLIGVINGRNMTRFDVPIRPAQIAPQATAPTN